MSKVLIFKSMSLDGFIAGPNDEIDPLHDWLFATRPASQEAGAWDRAEGQTERFFGPEGVNKDILMTAMATEGATVVGRRTYEVAQAWGGKPPGTWTLFRSDPQSATQGQGIVGLHLRNGRRRKRRPPGGRGEQERYRRSDGRQRYPAGAQSRPGR